jgi:hypothetical protein
LLSCDSTLPASGFYSVWPRCGSGDGVSGILLVRRAKRLR